MSTANDIIAAAQSQIGVLKDTSNSIDAQIDAIKTSGPDGPLSAQQLSEINSLRAAQKQVLLSIEKLALVTLAALDNSQEIAQLTASLATVAKGLQDQASKIANFGNIAQSITPSASDVAALVTQIKALAKG